MLTADDLVVWDVELSLEDKEDVGLEIASLGELLQHKVNTIPQIVITPSAFALFLKDNNLDTQIKHLLGTLNHERHDSLTQISTYAQKIIQKAEIHRDIVEPLFKKIDRFRSENLLLTAYYFREKKQIGSMRWDKIRGEAVMVEKVRDAWAHLFTAENLTRHSIHHENHHTFSVVLAITPEYQNDLTGYIKTFGKTKSEYEIEAHAMVKFTYNKNTNLVERGRLFPGGDKKALSASDLSKLLAYGVSCEKALYLPQRLYWIKYKGEFMVTKVIPATDSEYNDSYNLLIKNVTVHPGIVIGRLRVIDEKNKVALVMNDEIVMLKRIDRNMLDTIKKAKGIIIEEDPHPEVASLLKSFGIPTVIRKNSRLLYSTGDVVSLNATTGEVKRGSMLVS